MLLIEDKNLLFRGDQFLLHQRLCYEMLGYSSYELPCISFERVLLVAIKNYAHFVILCSFLVNNVGKTDCKFLTVSNMIFPNIHFVNNDCSIYYSNLSYVCVRSFTFNFFIYLELKQLFCYNKLSLVECSEPSGLNKEGGEAENSYLPRQNSRSISGLVLAILLLETNVPIFHFFMVSHKDPSPKKIVSMLNKKLYTERGSIFARTDFHEFHAFYCLIKT